MSATDQMKGSAPSGVQVFTVFLLYLGTQMFLVPLVITLWLLLTHGTESDLSTDDEYWLRLGGMGCAFLAVVLYTRYLETVRRRRIWEPAQPRQFSRLMAFVIGSASSLIAIPCVILVQTGVVYLVSLWIESPLVEQDAVSHLRRTLSEPELFLAMVFGIVILVPITEELLFRGFLQSWLKKCWGDRSAIFVTSLIFTLFHFSMDQGWTNASILVALWALAVILGILYDQSGSLWTSIGLHCTFNAVSAWLIFNDGAEKTPALGGFIANLLCWGP